MNTYIKKVLATYCDDTQTSIAKQTAEETLLNSGFTKQDLINVSQQGIEKCRVYLFEA